jgi:hypothetical protein
MAKITFATLVIPPPDPVMVKVNEPVGALAGMVTVSVEKKSGVEEGTLKTPPTPAGCPVTVKETCELKPLRPETLTEYDAV